MDVRCTQTLFCIVSKRVADKERGLSLSCDNSSATTPDVLPEYLKDKDKDEQVQILLQKVAGLEEQLHIMTIRVKQLEQAKGQMG